MAYNAANYQWTVLPGEERHSGASESSGKFKLTKQYVVIGEYQPAPTTVDAAWGRNSDVETAIYNLANIPQPYNLWDVTNIFSPKVINRTHTREIASPMTAVYKIEVEYETLDPRKNDKEQAENPEDLATKWTTGSFQIQLSRNTDLDLAPIQNAAGETFQNPPQTTIIGSVWRATRYERVAATNLVTLKQTYQGLVNSVIWNTYPINTVLCSEITGREETKQGVDYWHLTYTFRQWQFTADDPAGFISWRPTKVLNAGYYELKAGKLVRILDGRDQPVVTPQLLTAAGDHAGAGAAANYRSFNMLNEVAFGPLGLNIPGV